MNEYLNAAKIACYYSCPAAIMAGLITLGVLKFIHRYRSAIVFEFSDMRMACIAAMLIFFVTFAPFCGIGLIWSGDCGISRAYSYPSPDGRHKLVVFSFDCGATADPSLNVSLIPAGQALPTEAGNLYTRYKQEPDHEAGQKNFDVEWVDASHVTVRVMDFNGRAPMEHRDGVEVSLERLE